MMVTADYWKAFDTVRFKSVLTKMHVMGFFKCFLKWMMNYLCERRQFVHRLMQEGLTWKSLISGYLRVPY